MTVKAAPLPNPAVNGMTVYVAICWVLVPLVSVPVMEDAAAPEAPPVKRTFDTEGAAHE